MYSQPLFHHLTLAKHVIGSWKMHLHVWTTVRCKGMRPLHLSLYYLLLLYLKTYWWWYDDEKVASIRLNKIFEWQFLSGVSLLPSHTWFRAVITTKSYGALACMSTSGRVRFAWYAIQAWIRFAHCIYSLLHICRLYISDTGKTAIKWFRI